MGSDSHLKLRGVFSTVQLLGGHVVEQLRHCQSRPFFVIPSQFFHDKYQYSLVFLAFLIESKLSVFLRNFANTKAKAIGMNIQGIVIYINAKKNGNTE